MKKYFIYILAVTFFVTFSTSCKKESNPTEPHEEHFDAYGLILLNQGVQVMTYFNTEVYDTLFLSQGMSDHYEVMFLDEDSVRMTPPDDEDMKLGWGISDTTVLGIFQHSDEKWELHFDGKKTGYADLELQILHLDHPDFRTKPIPVVVK